MNPRRCGKKGREARGYSCLSALHGLLIPGIGKRHISLFHDFIIFAFPPSTGERWQWWRVAPSVYMPLPPHFTQHISNLFPIPHFPFLLIHFVNSIAGNETSRSEGQARDEVGQELNQIGQGEFAYV